MGVARLLPSFLQNIQESLPVFLEVDWSVVEHCYIPMSLLCKPVCQKTGLRKIFIFEMITSFFQTLIHSMFKYFELLIEIYHSTFA